MLLVHCVQAQNPAKILAPNYSYGAAPVPLPIGTGADHYSGDTAKFSQNIQVNNQGEILFFIVDGFVYDRKGDFLGFLSPEAGGPINPLFAANGYQGETLIINDPNCTNLDEFIVVTCITPGNLNGSGTNGTIPVYDKVKIAYDAFGNRTSDSYVLGHENYNNNLPTYFDPQI